MRFASSKCFRVGDAMTQRRENVRVCPALGAMETSGQVVEVGERIEVGDGLEVKAEGSGSRCKAARSHRAWTQDGEEKPKGCWSNK